MPKLQETQIIVLKWCHFYCNKTGHSTTINGEVTWTPIFDKGPLIVPIENGITYITRPENLIYRSQLKGNALLEWSNKPPKAVKQMKRIFQHVIFSKCVRIITWSSLHTFVLQLIPAPEKHGIKCDGALLRLSKNFFQPFFSNEFERIYWRGYCKQGKHFHPLLAGQRLPELCWQNNHFSAFHNNKRPMLQDSSSKRGERDAVKETGRILRAICSKFWGKHCTIVAVVEHYLQLLALPLLLCVGNVVFSKRGTGMSKKQLAF